MTNDRLQKALDFSKYRLSLIAKKEDLKLAVAKDLTFAYNGGIFKIDTQLIAFAKLIVDLDRDSNPVLIDANGNPIEILNIKEFYEQVLSRYFEATNTYHSEYTKIRKSRTVASIFNFFEEK
jgi:hypothetical protein